MSDSAALQEPEGEVQMNPQSFCARHRAFRRGRNVDAIRLLLLTTLGEMEDHVMRYVVAVLVVTMLFAAGCCCAGKKGSTAQQSAENRPAATTVSDDHVELE